MLNLECVGENHTIWMSDDGEVLGCLHIEASHKPHSQSKQFCRDKFGASSTLLNINSQERNEWLLDHRR